MFSVDNFLQIFIHIDSLRAIKNVYTYRTRMYVAIRCLALNRTSCVCVSNSMKMPNKFERKWFNLWCFLSSGNKTPTLPKPKRILFPIGNVHIGWKSLGRRWNVGSGMINMGNTCYLNSTLQAVFHVPSVASWLLSDVDHRQRCCDNGKVFLRRRFVVILMLFLLYRQ